MANFGIGSVIPFGKHKGRTVKHLLESDPSYLMWLRENTDHAFSRDLHAMLDGLLVKPGKNQYRGHKTATWLEGIGKLHVFADTGEVAPQATPAVAFSGLNRDEAYAGDWGSF